MKRLLQIGSVLIVILAASPIYWSGDEEGFHSKGGRESENSAENSLKEVGANILPEPNAKRLIGNVDRFAPRERFLNPTVRHGGTVSSERGLSKQTEADGYTLKWIGRAGSVPVIRKFKTGENEGSAVEWLADSLILRSRASHEPEVFLKKLESYGVKHVEPLDAEKRQWEVSISPNSLEEFFEISDQITSSPIVFSVGNNFIFKTGAYPNDPLLPMQYGFGPAETSAFVQSQNGFAVAPQNPNANVRADLAWESKRDCSPISIGVIDSGIDSTHPDLIQNLDLAMSRNFVSDAMLSDDCSQSPVAIPSGASTVVATKYSDENGHGTHVAGTIGALGNNGVGVSGVCWNAKIITIRTMNKCGRGSSASIIAGINYAAQSKIRVVNMSLGGNATSDAVSPGSTEYQAIADLGSAGGLVIAAAGNDSTDNSVNLKFPASVIHPALIAVASHNAVNQISTYSNFSTSRVHIAAPGEGIVSTIPISISSGLSNALNNLDIESLPAVPKFKQVAMNFPAQGYDVKNGTSMAAPHVAGVAALVWSMDPERTNIQVKELLFETADKITEFESKVVSGRRVNLGRAVSAAEGLSVRLGNEAEGGRVAASVATSEPVYVRLEGQQAANFLAGDLYLGANKIGQCSAFDGTCVGRIPSASSSDPSFELLVKKGSQSLEAGKVRVISLSDSNGLFGTGGSNFSCQVTSGGKVIASFKATSKEVCLNVCQLLSSSALDGVGSCGFGGEIESVQAEVCNAPGK